MQVSCREFHPFIRKVGIAGNILQYYRQNFNKKGV